jgi:serine/threonine protein kinase
MASPLIETPQRKSNKRKFYRSTVRFGSKSECYEIDRKYVGLQALGRGAYGTVVSALNTETKEKVAIKKIKGAFEDCSDAKRTLREIKMLLHLDNEHVCKIVDLIPPFTGELADVYIVMKQMDVDLHRVIYSSQSLGHNHIKYFVYQIVKAMNYIHSAGIVHRDLKPSNILVNENCSIKICDFGLARACADTFWCLDKSQYVVTRWYRAPELLCYYDGYDSQIDVWSIGCILAELYDREALFNGRNYRKTLEKILLTVGAPGIDDLVDIKRERNVYIAEGEDKNLKHNTDAIRFCRNRKHWKGVDFQHRFNHCGTDGADLLERLLQFNPYKRITLREALSHSYLSSWRVEESEKICLKKFDESYEHNLRDVKDVKK